MLEGSGTASLEFALVAIPFVLLLIAGMDLGRYFITQHSLRTLTSEVTRSAVINCSGLDTCPYATAVPSPSAIWATVPFLDSALPGVSLSASQMLNADGTHTITVSVTYPFHFVLPTWTGLYSSGITESTSLQY